MASGQEDLPHCSLDGFAVILVKLKYCRPGNYTLRFKSRGDIMHTTIRRYEGVKPENIEEIVKRVKEGFVPILIASGGFVGYQFIEAGNGVIATISVFKTELAARESNRMAANWVEENLAPLLEKPPQITVGEVRIDKLG